MESDGFWIGDPCDTFGGMNALVSSSKLKEDIYDEDDIDGTIAEEKRVTRSLHCSTLGLGGVRKATS